MRSFIRPLCVIAVACTAALLIAAKPAPPPPPAPLYTLRLLENPFWTDGWSYANRLNNLGDVIGRAQDRPVSDTIAGHSTFYISTREGRAAGTDMVDLRGLAADLFTDAEEATYVIQNFYDINDSRQVLARFAVFDVDHYVGHVLVFQLEVTPEGFHSLTSYVDLGVHDQPIGMNNSGDVLCRNGELYVAGLGWGQLPMTLIKPEALSDRNGTNQAYAVGTNDTAWPVTTGWRATIDTITGNVTSTVNLIGPFSRDRSTTASGVNSAGLVVGKMLTGQSDERAFVYEAGIMKNLGTLTTAKSWNDSYAVSINSTGDVVGTGMTGVSPLYSGLLFVKSKNTTYDSAVTLNAADRAIYSTLRPYGDSAEINDAGVICGSRNPTSHTLTGSTSRAYLLEPFVP
jgi:probable HAF family extracellular repeat protein